MATKKVEPKDTTANATVAVVPQETELAKRTHSLIVQAKAFVVRTPEDCERATEIRGDIKAARKWWVGLLGDAIKSAYDSHKQLKDKFNQYDDPLKEADGILGTKVGAFVREQQAKAEAERRQKQLEADRIALEAAEELKTQQAENLAAAGRLDEAAELVDTPTYVEPQKVVVDTIVPKVDGRTIRETFRAEVQDLKKLVNAVAAGTVPLLALMPDYKYLNSQAKFAKNTDALGYPGVVVIRE